MSEPERSDMRPKAEAVAVGAGALEVVALGRGAGAAKAVAARRAREEMMVVFIVMFGLWCWRERLSFVYSKLSCD